MALQLKVEIGDDVTRSKYKFLRHNTYLITEVKYGGKPRFESTCPVEYPVTGTVLPNGKGFSFDMQPPYACFKTIRSMYRVGLGPLVQEVLKTKTRSWITPDYIFDGLMHYTGPTKPRFIDERYDRILKEIEKEFRVDVKITPHDWELAAKVIPKSTSPGLPYIITHPGKKKGDILDARFDRIVGYWERVGDRKPVCPLPDCAAFARSHTGPIGTNKVRPVWAYPLDVILAESRFASPIIDCLVNQEIGHHTAYGAEMLRGGMEWIQSQCIQAMRVDPAPKFIMSDFSQFDSTVPAWLIRDCFSILRKKFNLNSKEHNIWKKVVSYFINTPVRNSDGRRILTDHGVPSGSMFTNIIDTMVNMIVSRYATLATTQQKPIFDVYFGDDALMCFHSSAIINLDDISKQVETWFGMKLNTKKSYWTNNRRNIHFLGYYNNFGSPVKPDQELVASMIYPQYLTDSWEYAVSRALGCLLAACGSSNNIFLAAQSVFSMAKQEDGVVERAMALIDNNPRAKRHFLTMGVDPINIGPDYFFDIRLSAPKYDCTKLMKGIDLIPQIFVKME